MFNGFNVNSSETKMMSYLLPLLQLEVNVADVFITDHLFNVGITEFKSLAEFHQLWRLSSCRCVCVCVCVGGGASMMYGV